MRFNNQFKVTTYYLISHKGNEAKHKVLEHKCMKMRTSLYPKVAGYSVTDKQDFKVRLTNVKLKEIDFRVKENLSPNRVSLRSKTLQNVDLF